MNVLIKTLSVILQCLIPGAGFAVLGYVRLALLNQGLLIGLTAGFCWSRWIFLPQGTIAYLAAIALIYGLGIILVAHKTQASLSPLQRCVFTLLFLVGSSAVFYGGFMTKQNWLGIHINFVPSISMQPTLQPGDFILVDSWAYHNSTPKLNDIVTFTLPQRKDFTVKRITHWPDQQLNHNDAHYVVGDNPSHSHDSRHIGGITNQQIRGKARLVLTSINKNGRLDADRTFIPIN